MASDIAIVSLTVTAAVGGFTLAALWAPPSVQASLPYMQASSVVFYASATNDFGAATVVGESPAVGLVQVGGLGNGVTRYVWARAKDPAGNLGDRYPAAGGVAVTTLTTAPGPNSVGTVELQNNAVTAQKMSVSQLSAITADMGTVNAGTINGVAINGSVITGGRMQTATIGERIVLDTSSNAVTVFTAGSAIHARLGMGSSGSGNPTLQANNGSGKAGRIAGSNSFEACEVINSGGGVGLLAWASTTGSTAHGIRAQALSGGQIVLGVSAASGGWAAYAESGNYGPFTGAHDALLSVLDAIEIGEIVCSTGRVIARSGVDDALLEVEVCTSEAQRGAYGIVSRMGGFDPYGPIAALPPVRLEDPPTPVRLWIAANFLRLAVNGCGEGLVLVCGRGGDIAIGDYICTSSMRGKGQRQNDASGDADDLLRRHTVAQATQSVTFDDPDEVRLVACVYKCG